MNRKRPSRTTASRRTGFSLIELLVVIVVIMILVGIGVAVGLKVMGSGQEKDTATTQELLVNAIATYYDVKGVYPGYHPDHSKTKTSDTNALIVELLNTTETQPMLMDIPKEQLDFSPVGGGVATAGELRDAWGKEMRYTTAYFGDQPCLISAGPDGKFGGLVKKLDGSDVDESANSYSEDNIRSASGM